MCSAARRRTVSGGVDGKLAPLGFCEMLATNPNLQALEEAASALVSAARRIETSLGPGQRADLHAAVEQCSSALKALRSARLEEAREQAAVDEGFGFETTGK